MKNDKPIRILHINNNLNPGAGVAENIINYYRIIDREKYKFDFFLYNSKNDTYTTEVEKNGDKVYKANGSKKEIVSNYIEVLKQNNYDIVELHAPIYSHVYLKYAKKAGVKNIICHSHSVIRSTSKIKNLLSKFLNLNISRDANHFWACSEKSGMYWFGSRIVKKTPNFKVIPNYIFCQTDHDQNKVRTKIRNSLKVSENDILLGFVGRLSKEKNLSFLLKVYEKLKKDNPNYKLVFVGEGNFKNNLEDIIRKKELTDVIFAGYQNNVSDWLQSLDLFLFPSQKEGLGMALIEAQLSGIYCYAMDSIPKETDIGLVKFLPNDCTLWSNEIVHHDFELTKKCKINTELYNPYKNVKLIEKYYTKMTSKK